MDKQALFQHLARQGYSQAIIKAFASVKREEFVPCEYQMRAYEDCALPTVAGQTISQPSTIAFMLSLLELDELREKRAKILEIGSGSGYVLALLAELPSQAELYGIELEHELVVSSRNMLRSYKNIGIIEGNGVYGLPEQAPFDRILVSAAAPFLDIVQALCKQLHDPGILVASVKNSVVQIKKRTGKLDMKEFEGFAFVPLRINNTRS